MVTINNGAFQQQNGSFSVGALSPTYNIVTASLTHLFDAGNTSSYPGSGTVWTNLSGSNNLALVAAPTYVSAGTASRFVFNGTNQWASGSGYLGNATDRRLSTLNFILSWGPISATFNNYRFFSGTNNPTTFSVGSTTSVNTINFMNFSQGTTNFTAPVLQAGNGYSFTSGKTYMMTYVSTATNISLYINGSFIAITNEPFSATGTFSSATETFGYAINDVRTGFVSMSLSHIMFYSSSLSPTQVLQNYNALKDRYGI